MHSLLLLGDPDVLMPELQRAALDDGLLSHSNRLIDCKFAIEDPSSRTNSRSP